MIIKVDDNGVVKTAIIPTKTSQLNNDRGFVTSDAIPVTSVNGEVGDVNLTKANIGLGSVENKSSATIRSELTQSDVTTALGFTPYTPAEVDALVSAVFHYKGTKATYAEVAALTDMKTGDVWQVTADNSEYVYNGSAWEKLGPTIDLSGYLTSVSVAGHTLTPSSNSITVAQLKTALGLKSAAYVDTESTVANDAKLPTGAAVKSFVEGKGYTTNTGTVTKVTAGTGLTGGDITTSGTIGLDTSGVTAGSAGPTAAVTGNEGTTVAIPRITVDDYGRVTELTSYNLTNKNTTYYTATTSANGLMSSTDKGIVDTVKYKVSLTAEDIIHANSDLNDTQWLKTGSYANPLSANTSSISNIPSGLTEAFMLNVYSPLSGNSTADDVTGNWIYRLQEITVYTGKSRWVRLCNTDGKGTWTYRSWTKIYPTEASSISGTLGVDHGGTGATSAADARTNLGLGSAATANTSSTVGNNTNLPTGAAIQTYVTGLGYTKNTGTVTKVSTGVGLTGGDVTTSGTIKAKLKSETASALDSSAMGSTASRQYAVGVDKSGYLSVNIPWENTQTLTGVKGDSESTYRTGNVSITKANIGLASVENKSSATIRGELTKSNVTDALGYTPPTTDTDTKNTAGSTDTSSKIFLIGATSQAANPQTYSDNEVYATSGVLTTKSVQVGGGSATLQFNSTTNAIDFIFA